MTTGVLARARAHVAEPLTRGAYSLMANTVVTSVLGVFFWIVAARLYSASEVGRDSVLITSTMALAGICQLNVSNAVPRFLPQVRDPARVLAIAYLATTGVALVAATAFVFVVPLFVEELGVLTDEPLVGAGFVISTAIWCVFVIQDGALAAMRRTPWVPVENAAYGALKLAALPLLLAAATGHGVFWSWVLPLILVVVPVNVFLFRVAIAAHQRHRTTRTSPLRDGRRVLMGFLLRDYAATVFAYTCWTVLPILVLTLVGSREAAYFSVAFIIVQALELMAAGAGISLVVESAFAEERLVEHTRSVLRRLLPPVLLGSALVVVAAPWILAPFGDEYARGGTTLLRLLGAAVAFRCVIAIFQFVERSRRRGSMLLAVNAVAFVLILGAAAGLAPPFELTGVGVAWLVANGVVAMAILPSLIRFVRSRPPDPPAQG